MNFIYKKHELYPDQILIRTFVGKVDATSIVDSWEYLIKNKIVNSNIKGIINDLSDCDLNMDMGSFETLLAFMKKQEFFRGIKLAVVTDSPKTIVFPTLGEQMVSEFKIKPFTTMQAAVDWISMDI